MAAMSGERCTLTNTMQKNKSLLEDGSLIDFQKLGFLEYMLFSELKTPESLH